MKVTLTGRTGTSNIDAIKALRHACRDMSLVEAKEIVVDQLPTGPQTIDIDDTESSSGRVLAATILSAHFTFTTEKDDKRTQLHLYRVSTLDFINTGGVEGAQYIILAADENTAKYSAMELHASRAAITERDLRAELINPPFRNGQILAVQWGQIFR